MDFLVFNTEQDAKTALETIYANMVSAASSTFLLDVTSNQQVSASLITSDEAVKFGANNRKFPLFGTNASTTSKDTKKGYTTAWATARSTLQGTWCFTKPDDSLLKNVTGYVVQPYSSSWFPKPNKRRKP